MDAPLSSGAIPAVSFSYEDTVRYTFWLADGAQRVVFGRDEVPPLSRAAVLVHVPSETSGELHGPLGYFASLDDESPRATLEPMAAGRARAFHGFAAAWRAEWTATRAELIALQIEASAPAAVEELDETIAPAPEATDVDPRANLRAELEEESEVSFVEIEHGRIIRSVGAREPLPRDFGLSIAVEPVWLFVRQDCPACEKVAAFLDQRELGYHQLLVTDPSLASTLKSLSEKAKVRPGVPALWYGGTFAVGADTAKLAELFEREPR